jgi:hypothetical protein
MNEVFQSIESNFIEGIQAHAQVTRWKAFFMHPNQVIFRDVAEQSSLVLAKGHGVRDDIDQDLGIHGAKNTLFSTSKTSNFPVDTSRPLGYLVKTT